MSRRESSDGLRPQPPVGGRRLELIGTTLGGGPARRGPFTEERAALLERVEEHRRKCEQCREAWDAPPGKFLMCPDGDGIRAEIAGVTYRQHMEAMKGINGAYRDLDPFAKTLRRLEEEGGSVW